VSSIQLDLVFAEARAEETPCDVAREKAKASSREEMEYECGEGGMMLKEFQCSEGVELSSTNENFCGVFLNCKGVCVELSGHKCGEGLRNDLR